MAFNRTGCLILVAVCQLYDVGSVHAEKPDFSPGDAVRVSAFVLVKNSLTHRKFDDELSRQWFQQFTARLDPQRMYFLHSDIEEFQEFDEQLDDFARARDFQFASRVVERYQERTRQAVSYAKAHAKVEHDYTIDEIYPTRFDTFATTEAELSDRWRLRMKAELMIEELHGRPLNEVQSQLIGRHERIAQQAGKLTDERMCQPYLDALASVFDPHGGYIDPTTLTSFYRTMRIPEYRLAIVLLRREGRFEIARILPEFCHPSAIESLVGCQVLSIRRTNGTIIDVVELPASEFYRVLALPWGPLEDDKSIVLELWNPVTQQRRSLTCSRHRILR